MIFTQTSTEDFPHYLNLNSQSGRCLLKDDDSGGWMNGGCQKPSRHSKRDVKWLPQRGKGYPRDKVIPSLLHFTLLWAYTRKGKSSLKCAVPLHQTAKTTTTKNPPDNRGKKCTHFWYTSTSTHTHTSHGLSFMAINKCCCCRICSQDSFVMSFQWPIGGDADLSHVCRRWVTDSWDCGKVTPGGQCTLSPAVCVYVACVCHSCSMSEDCKFYHSY